MPLIPDITLELTMRAMNRVELPDLGDARKQYPVTLTEPDINSIHFAVAFVSWGSSLYLLGVPHSGRLHQSNGVNRLLHNNAPPANIWKQQNAELVAPIFARAAARLAQAAQEFAAGSERVS
jgi:hypothetical protein